MARALFVGLDVGTTTSKAVAFTEEGDAVATGRADTPWTVTASGAHLDADALLASAVAAIADLLSTCLDGEIKGVGVASLAESGVLVDGSGRSVAPVIAWHDTRDSDQLADLATNVTAEQFASTTGLPLRQQWSLTKHRWIIDNVPGANAAVRRFNVAEWIVRGLGGEEATEQSLASRTGWLTLADRTWWNETLEWSGASAALMPELVTAGTPLGTVSAQVGLSRLTGATLTVAGHDHQAAAIGAGASAPGNELDSCGTAEALVRAITPGLSASVVAELAGAGITTGWHASPGKWCLLGASQGGLAMQRVLAMLGKTRHDLPALDQAAMAAASPSVQVTAPAFGKVGITGIGEGVGPGDIWRATLETVTDQIGEIHDAMSRVSGPHTAMVVTGGWSRSDALMSVKERRFGRLVRPDVTEAGARGAALLAATAAGFRATIGDHVDVS